MSLPSPPRAALLLRLNFYGCAALLFAQLAGAATTPAPSNPATITINDNANASPYPSQITVSGVTPAIVTKVQVTLHGLSHNFPDDVDVILVGPQGQRAVLMSDAGGDPNLSNVSLTFDQDSTVTIPDNDQIAGLTYRPANYLPQFADTFPVPGPGTLTDAPADLSVFDLTNPNGNWNLYVVDDDAAVSGTIANGWTLILTVPQIFTVTKTEDTNDGACNADCSLREAITAAQDGDLIQFLSFFDSPRSINLLTALPDIDKSVTIVGKGAHLLTVRRDYNAPDFRIFTIPEGVADGVAISGMTITGGSAPAFSSGGGIFSDSGLTLTGVHVTGNHADFQGGGVGLQRADGTFTGCTFSDNSSLATGGAIYYAGRGRTLRLVNSTVSGNGSRDGGGIISFGGGNTQSRLEVISSTIANNRAVTGGGIYTVTVGGGTSATTTTLRNSIVANNSASTSPNLITSTEGGGTATSQTLGFNLSNNYSGAGFTPLGTDITSATPRLGPLSSGGGTTPTHALLGGSPALDAGDASAQATDQRGAGRVFNITSISNVSDGSDIGAVEMQALIVTSSANGGTGSLRNILSLADSGPSLNDLIFDPAVFGTAQTIDLAGELPINSHVTINGPGANLLTVRRDPNSATDFRIFNIPGGITGGVAISGVTITGGRAPDFGGGIRSQSNLTLTGVHVSGNHAPTRGGGVDLEFADGVFTGCTLSLNTSGFFGGAIFYQGAGGRALRLVSSTVSGNQSAAIGGIINASANNSSNSRLEILNSTIANNPSGSGAGIHTSATGTGNTATTTLRNSILAGNTPDNLVTDGAATVITHGFNLASDNGGGFLNVAPITTDKTDAIAALATLSDNGGTMPTHALLGTSAALDAGSNSSSGTLTDQRGAGFARTVDLSLANAAGSDGTDIGAFEAQTTPTLPTISIADASSNEFNLGGNNFLFEVTLSAASGQPVTVSYQTADGTATAPSDYAAASGTVTFDPGQTSKVFAVLVSSDTTVEPDETFFVNLSAPNSATIADAQGQGTILNDDAELPPTPSPSATPTPSATATATPAPSATATASPTASPTPGAPPTTLANIATRLRVESGDNVLIGGIIITGTQPKKLIVRAIGPSSGVVGSLADPQLEMFDGEGTSFAFNNNWEEAANAQEIIDSTIPPSHPLEAAFAGTLTPGNYTAVVSGVNGATGIGVVEAYDLDRSVDSKFANIATRGFVQTGDDVMIGGLIVLGDKAQKVILRAIGPSLPVDGKLADPTLDLINGNGDSIGFNDNWRDSQQAEIEATTIPPTDDFEAAVVATLPPAPYTAVVRGMNDTTGIALVEVYALQ